MARRFEPFRDIYVSKVIMSVLKEDFFSCSDVSFRIDADTVVPSHENDAWEAIGVVAVIGKLDFPAFSICVDNILLV